MRIHGLAIGLGAVVAAGLAACSSSSTAPSGSGAPQGGGSNSTIMAGYSSGGGGAYGGGSASWWWSPSPDTVAAGTSVTFQWSGAQHNVHWDTAPSAVDSVPTANSSSAARMLSTPGTYSYHCTIHSMSGVIVVH